jgi:hypothetical protein
VFSHFWFNLGVFLVCAGIVGLAIEYARRRTQRLEEEIERLEQEVEWKRREVCNH